MQHDEVKSNELTDEQMAFRKEKLEEISAMLKRATLLSTGMKHNVCDAGFEEKLNALIKDAGGAYWQSMNILKTFPNEGDEYEELDF